MLTSPKIDVEEEEHNGDHHTTDWEVDIETPSPAEMVSKRASEKRSNNRCNTKYSSKKASIGWSLVKRKHMHDKDNGSTENPTASQTCNGATNNQSRRVGSHSTDQRPKLKYGDAGEVDPFGVKEGIDSTTDELKAAHSQEVCRGIPADVCKGVEVIGDDRNCSRNNEAVQGYEECCQETSEHNNVDSRLRRVLVL